VPEIDLGNLARFVNVPGVADSGAGSPPVDRGAYEFQSGGIFIQIVLK
jgi:hypothetical protein